MWEDYFYSSLGPVQAAMDVNKFCLPRPISVAIIGWTSHVSPCSHISHRACLSLIVPLFVSLQFWLLLFISLSFIIYFPQNSLCKKYHGGGECIYFLVLAWTDSCSSKCLLVHLAYIQYQQHCKCFCHVLLIGMPTGIINQIYNILNGVWVALIE